MFCFGNAQILINFNIYEKIPCALQRKLIILIIYRSNQTLLSFKLCNVLNCKTGIIKLKLYCYPPD